MQPLWSQGQYFDVESGLHYNQYRYYSPETARFITPDPLGLARVPGGCPPTVNVKHIFHGEINKHENAIGFHHERGIGHEGKARVTETTQAPNKLGIYKGKVEIFNPASGRWVAKGPESTFFPKHWDRAKVLNEVKGAYANATILPTARWSGVHLQVQGLEDILTQMEMLIPHFQS